MTVTPPRHLVLVPMGAVLLFFLAQLAVPAADAAIVNGVFNLSAFALAAFGSFAAAIAFERGDYLRSGWSMQGASSLLLFASHVLRRLESSPDSLVVGRAGLQFLSNLTAVVGVVIFARAHAVAGLELPWSRGARAAFFVVVAAVALAAAGPPLIIEAPRAGDSVVAIMNMVSSVGDLITLVLIAPIFMTALTLRGGALVWPWGLFTASTLCWLVYDAHSTLTYFVPALSPEQVQMVTVPLRLLACTLLFASGMAQRRLTLGQAGAPESTA